MAGAVRAHDVDATLSADPSIVAPGRGVTINGEGFTRGATVSIEVHGRDRRLTIGGATVDPAGGFHVAVEIPANLPTGAYELVAIDADADPVIGALQLDASATGGVAVDRGPPAPWIVGAAAIAALAVLGILRRPGRDRSTAPR